VAYRQARKAELRKDYDTALVNYEKAVKEAPENSKYIIHERLMREQASLFHLKKGKGLLAQRRTDDAMGEFQKAIGIDPSNQAAAQELTRLLEAQAAAKKARQESLKKAMQGEEQPAYPAEVQLKPFAKEPLAHFRISADSRTVYEALAKLSELNVAFTSDFRPSPVSLDLTNVKIEDALKLLGYQTKTFWKVVTSNTILIVPDTPANRRDYQDEVLKTVYLANPLPPADRTAITTALKQILGLQRIIDNPDSNAIVIRDTPDKVAAAEKLIHDLDRGKAEILIDVAVIEADRDRARDLGLTQVPTTPLPATSVAGLGFTATTTTTSGGTSVTVPGLPLNRLSHLATKDFSIVLPGAVANALLTDSHTHILQNPQVRVTDGLTAKVRIGSRVPFATGSFLPSFGGAVTGAATTPSIGLLASTQFQYQEVGVNLDITPHLLASGEVSLHASIEVSSVGPSFLIGGLSEPSFQVRKIEHDIRLKESEVNLLGGLIQSNETRTVSGLPGFGDLPFFHYFFSSERRERVETEVLVMLTPRVIRLPEVLAEEARTLSPGGPTGAVEALPPPETRPLPNEPQP